MLRNLGLIVAKINNPEKENEQVVLIGNDTGTGILSYRSKENTLKVVQLKPVKNDLSSLVAILNVR